MSKSNETVVCTEKENETALCQRDEWTNPELDVTDLSDSTNSGNAQVLEGDGGNFS